LPDSFYVRFPGFASDLDGTVVAWAWTFGDGSGAQTRQTDHIYSMAGRYEVCLVVTDNDGATGTTCHPVIINPSSNLDTDLDGIADTDDNCPAVANHEQQDADHNGIGNACDPGFAPQAPTSVVPAADRLIQAPLDTDKDSVADTADNCPTMPNRDQLDLDGDHVGDACDADIDGDGVPNTALDPNAILDNCPVVANSDQTDADSDGQGDACDIARGGLQLKDRIALHGPVGANVGGPDAAPDASLWGSVAKNPAVMAGLLGAVAVLLVLGAGLTVWSVRRWKQE